MARYVAAFNPSGVAKLAEVGARANGRTLVFFEDTDKHAHVFYRRYIRNFFGVVFNDDDYSIHQPVAPAEDVSIPLGMRENFAERTPAKPGRAGRTD